MSTTRRRKTKCAHTTRPDKRARGFTYVYQHAQSRIKRSRSQYTVGPIQFEYCGGRGGRALSGKRVIPQYRKPYWKRVDKRESADVAAAAPLRERKLNMPGVPISQQQQRAGGRKKGREARVLVEALGLSLWSSLPINTTAPGDELLCERSRTVCSSVFLQSFVCAPAPRRRVAAAIFFCSAALCERGGVFGFGANSRWIGGTSGVGCGTVVRRLFFTGTSLAGLPGLSLNRLTGHNQN